MSQVPVTTMNLSDLHSVQPKPKNQCIPSKSPRVLHQIKKMKMKHFNTLKAQTIDETPETI